MSELFQSIWKYGVQDVYTRERDYPFGEGMPMPVLIDVSNVAVYTSATLPSWEAAAEAPVEPDGILFNVAPPWPLYWMEYADPVTPNGRRYGCLLRGYDLREIPDDDPVLQDFPDLAADARWLVFTIHFTSVAGRAFVLPLGNVVAIGEDGTLNTAVSVVINEDGVKPFERDTSAHGGRPKQFMQAQLTIPLMATQFSHCKNVELDEPKPKTRSERRQQERRAKRTSSRGGPTFTFKTLDIGPVEHLLDREGNVHQQGLGKALHVCRGHWRDYRQRGLFGNDKLKGMYFVGMHVRGNKKLGAVHKSYRINTEQPGRTPS